MNSTSEWFHPNCPSLRLTFSPREPLNHSVLGDISHPAGYNPFRHDITAVCHFSLLVPSFCKNAHAALIIHALQCRSTASDTSKWFSECLESSSFHHAMSETDFFLSPNFINQNPKARRTPSESRVTPWIIPELYKVSPFKKCHRKLEAGRSEEVREYSPVKALWAPWRNAEEQKRTKVLDQRGISLLLVESLSQARNLTLGSDKTARREVQVSLSDVQASRRAKRPWRPCSSKSTGNTWWSLTHSYPCASRQRAGWLMRRDRSMERRDGGGRESEREKGRKRKNREKEGGEERGILSALGWVAQRQQKHSGIYSKVPLSMLTARSGERGWSWREENLLFFLSSLLFSAVSLICKNRHQTL